MAVMLSRRSHTRRRRVPRNNTPPSSNRTVDGSGTALTAPATAEGQAHSRRQRRRPGSRRCRNSAAASPSRLRTRRPPPASPSYLPATNACTKSAAVELPVEVGVANPGLKKVLGPDVDVVRRFHEVVVVVQVVLRRIQGGGRGKRQRSSMSAASRTPSPLKSPRMPAEGPIGWPSQALLIDVRDFGGRKSSSPKPHVVQPAIPIPWVTRVGDLAGDCWSSHRCPERCCWASCVNVPS